MRGSGVINMAELLHIVFAVFSFYIFTAFIIIFITGCLFSGSR